MTIKPDGTGGLLPKRVFSASSSNPRSITIANHLSNAGGTNFIAGSTQIAAVYASRGLDDKASYLQCDGVFGREVYSDASSGSTTVTLTTAVGITPGNSSTGDFVQFAGVVSGNNTTHVTAVNGNIITLSSPLIAPLPAARTLIFVKNANGSNVNKEFCVIPLNTAPPFAGTDAGLKTPETNKNLTVAGLKFGILELDIPDGNLTAIAGPPTTSSKHFVVNYGSTIVGGSITGGTNYKMLAV